MNTVPILITALAMLPAVGIVLWAWWTMRRAENDLRSEAGLQDTDFDIGSWPAVNKGRVA